MDKYLGQVSDIIANGNVRGDRTGTGTIGLFGTQMHYDLSEGFPLLTTKKVSFKNVAIELLWFLSGSTDVKVLQDQGCKIWDEWATKEKCAVFDRMPGDLGPIYGHQWRNSGGTVNTTVFSREDIEHANSLYEKYSLSLNGKLPDEVMKNAPLGYNNDGFDQISWVINEIKNNPNSRRLIVSGWNPAEANRVALPPCHTMFQFYVQDGKLSCQLYCRSIDNGLGKPYNIASYALLTHMVAHVCDLDVGSFIMAIGDDHVYSNHLVALNEQLTRIPYDMPNLIIKRKVESIFDFTLDDFELDGYQHHPAIKMDVSV